MNNVVCIFIFWLILCSSSVRVERKTAHKQNKSADFTGQWYTEKNEGLIEVTARKSILNGLLIQLKEPNNKDGLPKKDFRNKNIRLRERSLIGIPIIYGLKYDEKENRWKDGKIYIPKLGYEADCYILLQDKNTLKVKAFLGSTVAGHTQIWRRKDP